MVSSFINFVLVVSVLIFLLKRNSVFHSIDSAFNCFYHKSVFDVDWILYQFSSQIIYQLESFLIFFAGCDFFSLVIRPFALLSNYLIFRLYFVLEFFSFMLSIVFFRLLLYCNNWDHFVFSTCGPEVVDFLLSNNFQFKFSSWFFRFWFIVSPYRLFSRVFTQKCFICFFIICFMNFMISLFLFQPVLVLFFFLSFTPDFCSLR